jgi:hypothetical protein
VWNFLVAEDCYSPELRKHFFEQSELACGLLRIKIGDASDVPAGALQCSNHPERNRIKRGYEYDRYLRGRFLRSAGRNSAHGSDHIHVEADELGRKFWHAIELPASKARLDQDILSVHVAKFFKALPKSIQHWPWPAEQQHPDPGHLGDLLG